jgi:SAM-dependent methyltransferase
MVQAATRVEPIADPIEFWEQRHAALDPWRSGGDRGLGAAENREFYFYRLGRIIEMLRRHVGIERGLRILDAGSGRGHFTDALVHCGHDVIGIDTSESAVAWAQEAYGPHFVVAGLDRYRSPHLFEAIVCIDVLFHILDDGRWRAALHNLSRLAQTESSIILTDVLPAERYTISNYIVHRSEGEYDDVLRGLDFQRAERAPYDFGANSNQFVVYRRRF